MSLAVALHTSRAIVDALPKDRCDRREALWRDDFQSEAIEGIATDGTAVGLDVREFGGGESSPLERDNGGVPP